MLKRQWVRYKEFLVVAAGIFCFYGISIGGIYGFSIFPDEFAYWAYAAAMDGYDWSEILSLGSYYSYGYSLLLFPIFTLCRNAVTAYRLAVGVNFLALFLAYICLVKGMEKLTADKGIPIALISGLVICFPGNLFYARMTMTETLLVCLYVMAGTVLLSYLENNRLSALLLFMLIMMYSYIVHMRTIGILISGILILLFHSLAGQGKKKHIPVILVMTGMLFLCGDAVKEQILIRMYDGIHQELAAGNDYGGQLDKIRYLFTTGGFYDFIVGIFGKILYLGLATYGLFYWGIYALAGQLVKLFRRIRTHIVPDARQEFAVFVLLSVMAQILIAAVYLLTLGEIDDYTYGRYNELIIPFVMAAGFVTLWRTPSKRAVLVTGIMALVQGIVAFLVVRQIAYTGADVFYGYFMVGISYLYRNGLYHGGTGSIGLPQGEGFDAGGFYLGAYLAGEALTIAVTAIVLRERKAERKALSTLESGHPTKRADGRKKGKKEYALMTFMVLEILLAARMGKVYLEPFQKAAFRDCRLAEKIAAVQANDELQEKGDEKNEEINDRNVIYMDGNMRPFVGILQFMARDTKIQVMERRASVSDYNEEITGKDILIFAFDDIFWQEWTGRYAHADVYGHFAILYN